MRRGRSAGQERRSMSHIARPANMSANGATWNPERVEQLKRCFHAGLTCSQIAREIGVTRNAVIGKMTRLGLTRPRDVLGRQLRRAGELARPKGARRPKRPPRSIFTPPATLLTP